MTWWDWLPLGVLIAACLTLNGKDLRDRRRRNRQIIAEAQKPPARQEASPSPAAPGTRQPRIHPRHGRHLLTARFYTGGSVIWDAQGRKIAEFCEPMPSDDDFDDWLRNLTQ